MMPFATALQKQRMRRKLSLGALARLAGLSAPALSRWERGTRMPNVGSVRQLADAMRLDGEERDTFFLAAGFAPPQGDYRLTTRDPVIEWLRSLLAHPAMNEVTRSRFLGPALHSMGMTAIGILVKQGVPIEDLPEPPPGSDIKYWVIHDEATSEREVRVSFALAGGESGE